MDPQLKNWTRSLLEAMQWDGPAMVEYRFDRDNDRVVLLEVNGRFWAPLGAALKLGLNFPYAYYCYLCNGVRGKLPDTYKIGQRNMYLRGELAGLHDHVLGYSPDYLASLPSRLGAVWNCLKDLRPGISFDVLYMKDPMPGVLGFN